MQYLDEEQGNVYPKQNPTYYAYVILERIRVDTAIRQIVHFLAASNQIATHTLTTTIRTPKCLTSSAHSVGYVGVALRIGARGVSSIVLAVNAF